MVGLSGGGGFLKSWKIVLPDQFIHSKIAAWKSVRTIAPPLSGLITKKTWATSLLIPGIGTDDKLSEGFDVKVDWYWGGGGGTGSWIPWPRDDAWPEIRVLVLIYFTCNGFFQSNRVWKMPISLKSPCFKYAKKVFVLELLVEIFFLIFRFGRRQISTVY